MKILYLFATILCLIIGGCGHYTRINIITVDDSGIPIENSKITIGYSSGGGWSPFKLRYHTKHLITNSNGKSIYRDMINGPNIFGVVKKDGFYDTSFEIKSTDFKLDSSYHVDYKETFKEPLVLYMKKINKNVQMYAKEAVVYFPSNEGSFGYDLVNGDLVAPYGKGVSNDFIFLLSTKQVKYGENKTRIMPMIDIQFSSKNDGIVPFMVRETSIQKSELRSSQEAPLSGYFSSLNDAINTIKGEYSKYDINYYFRVRSDEMPMYGKIYNDFVPGLYSKGIRVEFIYFLNPDGTKSVEYDPKGNLLKNINGKNLEYAIPPDNF